MTASDNANPPELLAAIDMGSNSFHMVVARQVHGEIRTLEKMGRKFNWGLAWTRTTSSPKKPSNGPLPASAALPSASAVCPGSRQIVGTNALRVARNTQEFIARAEEVLGYPVEIIAGREEARLIYLGVSHTLSDDTGRRLVVDIGGGSTEFIIGERFETQALESLHMGCVSFRNRYFLMARSAGG